MTNLLARAVLMSTPLFLGSLSEVFAERTGMMVCAIEGIFLVGAWSGFVGTYLTSSFAVGLTLAALSGALLASLYAFVTVTLKQQQVVTGTAVNIFALGFCAFFQRVIFGVPLTPLVVKTLPLLRVPLLWRIPFFGKVLFTQNIVTYAAYILVPLGFYVMFRTSLGLEIRSAGENPVAVDTAGIDVQRLRFITVMASGAISGIAGAFYTIGYVGMFSTNIIGGRGWIAFAICFLGNWTPIGALFGTLAFGLADSISIFIQTADISSLFPREFIIALPYILTIVLTVLRKDLRTPAKLGIPYLKE